jgi:hypothetical protein
MTDSDQQIINQMKNLKHELDGRVKELIERGYIVKYILLGEGDNLQIVATKTVEIEETI